MELISVPKPHRTESDTFAVKGNHDNLPSQPQENACGLWRMLSLKSSVLARNFSFKEKKKNSYLGSHFAWKRNPPKHSGSWNKCQGQTLLYPVGRQPQCLVDVQCQRVPQAQLKQTHSTHRSERGDGFEGQYFTISLPKRDASLRCITI